MAAVVVIEDEQLFTLAQTGKACDLRFSRGGVLGQDVASLVGDDPASARPGQDAQATRSNWSRLSAAHVSLSHDRVHRAARRRFAGELGHNPGAGQLIGRACSSCVACVPASYIPASCRRQPVTATGTQQTQCALAAQRPGRRASARGHESRCSSCRSDPGMRAWTLVRLSVIWWV
jgi:hypothetical protein